MLADSRQTLGFPTALGDEVDDALLGLEGPRHAEEGGGLSAAFHKHARIRSSFETPQDRPYGPPLGERYSVLPKDTSP